VFREVQPAEPPLELAQALDSRAHEPTSLIRRGEFFSPFFCVPGRRAARTWAQGRRRGDRRQGPHRRGQPPRAGRRHPRPRADVDRRPLQPGPPERGPAAIYTLGFFDDVQMRVEDFEGGVKVTFVVVERPFIRDVQFAGNKKIDTNTLLEKAELKLGSVYNPVEVEKAAQRLKDQYEEEATRGQDHAGIQKFADGDVRVTFASTKGGGSPSTRSSSRATRG